MRGCTMEKSPEAITLIPLFLEYVLLISKTYVGSNGPKANRHSPLKTTTTLPTLRELTHRAEMRLLACSSSTRAKQSLP